MGICCLKSDTRPFKKLETNPAQKDNAIDVSKGGVGQYKTKGKDGVVQKAKPVDIQQSLMRSVLELFFRSERLRDLTSDEDIITNPLSTSKSEVAAVQAMKAFLKVINSQDDDVEVALQALQKHGLKDEPAVQIFNTLQTVFKVIRIENKGSSASIKETLQSLVDMPYSGIEGTEIEPVLLEGLLKDVETATKADHSQDDPEAKLAAVKAFISNSEAPALWPLCKKLPQFAHKLDQLLYMPTEDLTQELESFLQAARGHANQALKGKLYDAGVIGPHHYTFGPMTCSNYACLPMLSMGTVTIDGSVLVARVKKLSVQVFQEPDIESIKKAEIVEFTSCYRDVLDYSAPLYQSITVGALLDKLADAEDNPNLKSDFDPICLYSKDENIYYCYRKALLQNRGDAYGNANVLRLQLVRQKELMEQDSFKIVIAPDGVLNCTKHSFYILGARKDQTLQVVADKIKTLFSSHTEFTSERLDRLLESLVFSANTSAARAAYGSRHSDKCREFVRSRKWATPLSEIVAAFGEDCSAAFDLSGQNKVDLLITLDKKRFGGRLAINYFVDGSQMKFLSLKPSLSDLFDQFVGEAFRAAPTAFTEDTVRELMPNYLYVDLKSCSSLVDITPELRLGFLADLFEEYYIEFSPKFRAVGFVAEHSITGLHYAVKVDSRSPNKVSAVMNGKARESAIGKLASGQIRGVYYQRCAKEL